MANMLIRTTRSECKLAIAVALRVLLFFGIPSFYFLWHSDKPATGKFQDIHVSRQDVNNVLRSRRLLGLPVDTAHAGNCTPAAILEFPPDGFSHWQRRHGFIVIHCVLAVYCFLLLGTVCEQYFVPAIEKICERLKMPADVAGATFMAAASSSPELFINCVGTFVTEGDLGIGAVVGSAVFNVLAVPACCALFAGRVNVWENAHETRPMVLDPVTCGWRLEENRYVLILMTLEPVPKSCTEILTCNCIGQCLTTLCTCIWNGLTCTKLCKRSRKCLKCKISVIDLDWWSISRDCLMYAMAVVALILTLLDNRIYWHEALLLVLMYTLYILAMVFNGSLGSFVRSGCCGINKPKMYTEKSPLLLKGNSLSSDCRCHSGRIDRVYNNNNDDLEQGIELKRQDSIGSEESVSSLWSWPDEKSSGVRKSLWVLTWPISLVLWATVPDSRRHPRLYPLTFAMCIVWIGGVSYIVAWIITIIGDTLNIPDSITGLTILAAGTSLPEAVSSILVTNHGQGTMGISNSIGSNTFDILLCLGLPWLIKSLFYPSTPGHHWVSINSSGISYSAISLLSTLFTLYGALAVNKFQLDWKIGVTCLLVYAGFMLLAALIELNVFFPVNLPVCPH